jgi:hypothetical protein
MTPIRLVRILRQGHHYGLQVRVERVTVYS